MSAYGIVKNIVIINKKSRIQGTMEIKHKGTETIIIVRNQNKNTPICAIRYIISSKFPPKIRINTVKGEIKISGLMDYAEYNKQDKWVDKKSSYNRVKIQANSEEINNVVSLISIED